MSELSPAPVELEDAAQQGLGALLLDKDVVEIASLEGGVIEVVRRGRRERLDAILEGPLFAALRDAGAETRVVRVRLRGGQQLVGAPLADGRIALRILKAPPLDVTLEALVQEGLLPSGIPEELVSAAVQGAGVLVLGPSRAGRQRVAVAVARAITARISLYGLTDTLASLLPVPLTSGTSLAERARAAQLLGADAVCALELDVSALVELARAGLGLPLVASATAAAMDGLQATLDQAEVPVSALAGTSVVIGYGPDGSPRLAEIHGPTRSVDEDIAPVSARAHEQPTAPSMSGGEAPHAPAAPRRAPAPVVASPDGLPPLGALPAEWASDHDDDDPGWELAGAGLAGEQPEPAAGSFDAALAAQRSARPTFAPRPPPLHPQSAALQGRALPKDPFGGLTFEPPPGGHGDDEGER